MKVHAREVVKTDNGDGTYRLSIEDRGEIELPEPSRFRKALFFLAEKIVNLLMPRIKPTT